jgi:hypothetical protein
MHHKIQKDEIVLYTDKKGNVELRADTEKDTLWATQAQIAHIFEVDVRTISEHILNIFKTKELVEISVVRKFRNTGSDGKKYVMKFYNLDVMIAVGYRVNSKRATKFRIWATGIIRNYVTRGYVLNHHRLNSLPERVEGLREAIAFLESTKHPGKVKAKVVLKVTKEMQEVDSAS